MIVETRKDMEKNEQNEKSIPLPALESKNLYIAPEIPKKKKKLPWIVGVLSVVLITFIGVAGYVTVDNANKAAETARMEQEYRNALDNFLFYEYCEWVYVGNLYNDNDSPRYQSYVKKAKALAIRLRR